MKNVNYYTIIKIDYYPAGKQGAIHSHFVSCYMFVIIKYIC